MNQSPETLGGAPTASASATATSVDLAELNEKLDVLSVQVGFLIDQAQETARRQRERSELMQDALPIANDAIDLVTRQLAEIQDYIDLSDILRVFKRFLRDTRNIENTLDQLQSLQDFVQTAGPLANGVFEKMTDQLQVAEQRGYFALAGGAAHAVDRLASSLTPQDLDCLANNAVVLLAAFKGLCQPVESTSFRSLLGQMRDPEVRRGLAVVMRMLGAIGAEARTSEPKTNTITA